MSRPRIHPSRKERDRAYYLRKKQARHFRTQFSGNNEWYTPSIYLASVRDVLGTIDLDPASSHAAQEAVKATKYYTIEDNAFLYAWDGRVFLNPPYTQPLIHQFIQRLVDEFEVQHVVEAILLTHNYTDTAWFHLAGKAASCFCITKGRVRFVDAEGNVASPTQGQVFFYFGSNVNRFHEVFSKYGTILY